MPNQILIISHTFPPSPGIGGRRWVKFAKYLHQKNHKIYVLAAENIQTETSVWHSDIENLEIEYLPYHYPKSLSLPVHSFLDKLSYRFNLIKLKFKDKGNYYDKTVLWENQIQNKVRDYVRLKNIDTIIVTGPPFRIVYYVTQLKQEFKQVTFISDLRDLWASDTEMSAFARLNKKRKSQEFLYQQAAVRNSDSIFTVAEKMRAYFASLSSIDNCILIPNGFDPSDYEKNELTDVQTSTDKVNFIFTGTVYNNLDYILIPFFEGLAQLKLKSPHLYEYLNFEFYGKFPEKYKTYIYEFGLNDKVIVKGEKPYSYVTEKLKRSHYAVLFLNNVYNYSFSTKFCEYLAHKKKILVVSSKGDTSDYVVNNNIGLHVKPEDTFLKIKYCIEKSVANKFLIDRNEEFETSHFSIPEITRKIETHLNKLHLENTSPC